jgi:hypothetical protein
MIEIKLGPGLAPSVAAALEERKKCLLEQPNGC